MKTLALLHDIQRSLLDPSSSIGPILLKLRYLANKLGTDLLEDWVKHETEGYPRDAEVPEYRRAMVHYTGTFTDGHYQVKNVAIPPATIHLVGGEERLQHSIRESIAVIDKLVATEDSAADRRIGLSAADLAPRLLDKVYEGMGCVTLTASFAGTPFSHIQNTVRAKILDLTLELEKQVPIASMIEVGTAAGEVDAASSGAAAHITQVVIYGNQTNISNTATSGGSIHVGVVAGDQTSLVQYLVERGVPENDAQELADLAARDQPAGDSPIGEKAKGWLEKAAGGVWGVTKEVGTQILTGALKSYYGLPG